MCLQRKGHRPSNQLFLLDSGAMPGEKDWLYDPDLPTKMLEVNLYRLLQRSERDQRKAARQAAQDDNVSDDLLRDRIETIKAMVRALTERSERAKRERADSQNGVDVESRQLIHRAVKVLKSLDHKETKSKDDDMSQTTLSGTGDVPEEKEEQNTGPSHGATGSGLEQSQTLAESNNEVEIVEQTLVAAGESSFRDAFQEEIRKWREELGLSHKNPSEMPIEDLEESKNKVAEEMLEQVGVLKDLAKVSGQKIKDDIARIENTKDLVDENQDKTETITKETKRQTKASWGGLFTEVFLLGACVAMVVGMVFYMRLFSKKF